MKFYSQILSEYSSVINQIKSAAEQDTQFLESQNYVEKCSELNYEVENSAREFRNVTDEFDQVFTPGLYAKLATSEELLKLNEILKTISFNEQGKLRVTQGHSPYNETCPSTGETEKLLK